MKRSLKGFVLEDSPASRGVDLSIHYVDSMFPVLRVESLLTLELLSHRPFHLILAFWRWSIRNIALFCLSIISKQFLVMIVDLSEYG